MKIAIDVSQSIYGTGVSVYTHQLVSHLAHLPKTKLILFGGSLRRKSELDIWINRLPHSQNKTNHFPPAFYNLLWNNLHLYSAEHFTGPVDLIHTSDWAEPPSKLPKITTVHDLNFMIDPDYAHPQIRQVHKKRLYWVSRESTRIIAVSQATKNDLTKYFDVDPSLVDVIYEGPSQLAPPPTSPEAIKSSLKRLGINLPFILIPGSGHPRKNLKNIARALTLQKVPYQFVVIGRPSQAEIKLKKHFLFTGFVSQSDYSLLLSQAELLLYPSLYEGFGIPILDAFNFSLPVLTSNTSSLPEVAGSAATLVDPEDPHSIATGIIKTINNRQLLIKKGRLQAKKFTWQKTAEQTRRLYQLASKLS